MEHAFWGESLRIGVVITLVPLVIMGTLGLFMAVVQTALSLQEQTITYLMKLAAMGLVVTFLWGWVSGNLTRIMESALSLG